MSQTLPDRVDAAVSYSRADQIKVDAILAALRAKGLTVWFDKDITGGALWEEIIAKKYRASGALIFFVSKASLESQRCSEEVSTARTLNKPIIPVLLDPLKLPDDLPDRFVLTLQARNTVDVFDKTPDEAEEAILKALAGFSIIPGAPPPPSAVPPPKPKPAAPPPRPPQTTEPRKGVPVIAFGGAALALILVIGGYFAFLRHSPEGPSSIRANGGPTETGTVSNRPAGEDGGSTVPAPSAPVDTPAPTPAASTGDVKLTLDKPSYLEGQPIAVEVSGLPGDDHDSVTIAEGGSKPGDSIYSLSTEGAKSRTMKFRPIEKAGHYEVRAFFGAKDDERETVRGVAAFDVQPAAPVTLTLDKPDYVEGDRVIATVKGLPGNERDLVAIAKAGADDDESLTYEYSRGVGDATIKLKPVMTAGDYEVRVYFDDEMKPNLMRAKAPFTVKPYPAPALTLDQPSYPVGHPIVATVKGLPGNDRDWVAIAELGTEDNTYVSYVYTEGKTDPTLTLKPLPKPGKYEARVYFDDTSGDKTVRARVPFEVTAAIDPVLKADQDSYKPGETAKVSFENMPGNAKDWVAFGKAGGEGSSYESYAYTEGKASGRVEIKAPDKPGEYEIRAYFDDSTGDKTIRARIPVKVSE